MGLCQSWLLHANKKGRLNEELQNSRYVLIKKLSKKIDQGHGQCSILTWTYNVCELNEVYCLSFADLSHAAFDMDANG